MPVQLGRRTLGSSVFLLFVATLLIIAGVSNIHERQSSFATLHRSFALRRCAAGLSGAACQHALPVPAEINRPAWAAARRQYRKRYRNLNTEGVLRCAVVASGANLLEGELGQEIDEHDVVIRMNHVSVELFDLSESVILNRRLFFLDPQAPVLGFQKHVGRKTNFRWLIHPSCNSYIFLDWEAQDPQKIVPTVVMCSSLSKKQFKKYTQNYADANYEVLRRVQRRRLDDNMSSVPVEDVVGNLELFVGSSIPFYSILTGAEYGLKLPEHPSTGIWAILHACSVCEFVTAYGFTIADKTINGTTTLKLWHYYSHPDDASMLPVKNQPHKFHQEREVLQRLQNLSLIKMRSPRSR